MAADAPFARALWITGPRRAELRSEPLPELVDECVEVQATFSGVSRGTEALVFRGGVPPSLHASMRCPHQAGELSFPVKYGYCSVGRVTRGALPQGTRVFCLYPHQDRYVVRADQVVPLPEVVPDARAVLAANMETAINGLWDAAPGIGARVAVIGAGAVGLLCASLLQHMPGIELEVLELDAGRRELCRSLGLHAVAPGEATGDCDLVIHASGTPAGLDAALDLAGFEASIVELSWYGNQPVSVTLGGRFHSSRLRLQSSQVGQVAASQRPRWSYRRRLQLAVRLLADPRYDSLLGEAVPFDALSGELPRLLESSSGAVTQLVRYA